MGGRESVLEEGVSYCLEFCVKVLGRAEVLGTSRQGSDDTVLG